MGKKKKSELLIVESPTKEKTISRFLQGMNRSGSEPKDFIVKSSFGHIRDLPANGLGVATDKNFKPSYVILPKAKRILSVLKKISAEAEKIYLATDYDREGEAIAWHLTESLKLDKEKVKRITFHEITEQAIMEALKNPRGIDLNLVNAQQARRILDRLVGYKLSPLLWRKVQSGLSAGRVQSVALRIICDREEEIGKFQPQEYWTVGAELAKIESSTRGGSDLGGKESFFAELIEYQDKKLEKFSIPKQEEAEKIVGSLNGLVYLIKTIALKEKKREPSPPFTTATLQQEAVRKLFFSAKKTMFLAQQLYEGVELGAEGMVGLITYHRTDSYQVAESARNEALKYIIEKYGKDFVPAKPRIYKTKVKGAQEAHEAIRPTSVYQEPEKIINYLSAEQLKLYTLIWQRFLASQMAPAIFDTMTVDIAARSDRQDTVESAGSPVVEKSGVCLGLFRTNGQKIKFPGFLKIYDLDEEKEKILPNLNEGERLQLLKLVPEQHFTEPPARYNEASLIKTLEKYGIGRPSTYAPTISTIIERRYAELKERKFYPSELGKTINELIKKHFPKIVDINFTADMEKDLDEIAKGKITWTTVLDNFYGPFSQALGLAEKEMVRLRPVPQPTDEKCEKCGRMMWLRTGPRGSFLACSGFPRCRNIRSYNQKNGT